MAEKTLSNIPRHSTCGQSRPGVIIAALLYLIAAYQRTPCPNVAHCIVRHLECLAGHEAADPVIREICHTVRDTWALAASGRQPERAEHGTPAPKAGHVQPH